VVHQGDFSGKNNSKNLAKRNTARSRDGHGSTCATGGRSNHRQRTPPRKPIGRASPDTFSDSGPIRPNLPWAYGRSPAVILQGPAVSVRQTLTSRLLAWAIRLTPRRFDYEGNLVTAAAIVFVRIAQVGTEELSNSHQTRDRAGATHIRRTHHGPNRHLAM